MAVLQKAISRGVSEMETPTFDLNHWRSSSTSEIRAIGVLQMKEANRTRSSKACSGSVSRMAYLWRASTRAASFLVGLGFVIFTLPPMFASQVYTQNSAHFSEPFWHSESFAT